MLSGAAVESLKRHAETIPSQGGRKIGECLRAVARDDAVPGTAIVELGCWMGAGTAYLALGLRERQDEHNITIHSFDNFQAKDSEVLKARADGITLETGQDTLPIVKDLLAPFGAPISFHKGRIEQGEWDGTPISVHVQDAGKDPDRFLAMIKKFGPSWIPGKTVLILMDYYYWRKTGEKALRCQTEFVEANSDHFSDPVPLRGTSSVMLRYLKPCDFSKVRVSGAAGPSRLFLRKVLNSFLQRG